MFRYELLGRNVWMHWTHCSHHEASDRTAAWYTRFAMFLSIKRPDPLQLLGWSGHMHCIQCHTVWWTLVRSFVLQFSTASIGPETRWGSETQGPR